MTNGLNDTSHKSKLIIANMFDYSSQMIAFAKVKRIPLSKKQNVCCFRGLRDLPIKKGIRFG